MLIFMSLTNLMALIFISAKSPITMVLLVMANSLNACMLIYLILQTSWFSYILFLIFLGGLMVLFIYMCSVASNEISMNSLSANSLIYWTTLSSVMALMMSSAYLMTDLNFMNMISKLVFMINFNIMLVTLGYLLLTLFVSVVISKMKFGPVRAKKN